MPNSEEKIGKANQDMPALMPGSFDDDAVTRGLLADGIRKCGLSRDQIAERMSFLLSFKVTSHMLNGYIADSKENHRFPFAWTRAFCQATGDWRLLRYIVEKAEFLLLTKEDADIVTLGELVIQQENARNEITRHSRNIIERRSGRA